MLQVATLTCLEMRQVFVFTAEFRGRGQAERGRGTAYYLIKLCQPT